MELESRKRIWLTVVRSLNYEIGRKTNTEKDKQDVAALTKVLLMYKEELYPTKKKEEYPAYELGNN